MEKQHRDILIELRIQIVDDLDVYNAIIDPLTSEYVLRNEDIKKIEAGQSKRQRAQILLDILPGCGPYAFDVFCRALKKHYPWLNSGIEKMLRSKSFDATDMGRISPGAPNLPPQPEMTVTREAKVTQLKNALRKLEPGGYLALHGMKGFGKSCLTANTLKDVDLVKTAFNNGVYWIKFGYERLIQDEILIQLNFLYHQIQNSEIINPSRNLEPLKGHFVHYLRNHFSKEKHRNALLILDDVWKKEIIDTFDFHCKTLVITTDIDILDGRHRDVIEMKDGFSVAESLGLFAKVLETTVDKLPVEAKKIHDECDGMPILIAMFAAQFEEFKHDMKISQHRWKYYLNSLRKKDSTNKVIEKFLTKQEAIFDMCIERLAPDARTKYENLAIFSQDVNIMPQTLEILWKEELCKVDEHMLDFCHKSLAAKHWNVDLKCYVYGVHDLLLCHLRRKMTPEKLRGLHRAFIERYREVCRGDFSKLPDDNYSFSYIGHHLEQSEMYDTFPKLYLDFDFIIQKICHTGISDLLIDLKKYRSLIIGSDQEGEAKVKDLEKFLENQAATIAEHRRRDCLDLTQIGINHTPTGYVSEKTAQLATAEPSKLYVTHDHSSLVYHKTVSSEEVPTDGSTACFTDDENQILIGNCSGEVVLWDCKTRGQTVFAGHNRQSVIKKITVAGSGDFFLTLCNTGQVKLFLLRRKENNSLGSGDPFTSPVQSPREKQPYWKKIFNDKLPRDDSQATFTIDKQVICDMALSQNDERIGACTDSGIIQVWSIDGTVLYTTQVKNYQFERIAFTHEGSFLHTLDHEGVLKIYIERANNSELFTYNSTYNLNLQKPNIIFFQHVPGNERSLIVVTDVTAVYVKWNEGQYPQSVYGFSKQQRASVEDPEARFVCAALTYDGLYLITADSKNFIVVWTIEENILQSIATFNGRVNSLDTYWMEEGCTHLICGSGNRVIHRWTLALEQLPKSVRKPLFDAVVKPWGEVDIVAKETPEKTIVLCHGNKEVARTAPVRGKIIRLSFNSKGDKVLYATDDGVITVFDQETKKSTEVLKYKVGSTPSILRFLDIESYTFVVCGEENNLKVTFGNVLSLVANTGDVISIHTIDKNFVALVARNGYLSFWHIHNTSWLCIGAAKCCVENESLTYGCLSPNEKTLTLLKASGETIVYDIVRNVTADRTQIEVFERVKHHFGQKMSCCAYSQDDIYLAIGLENGNISIFDVPGGREITQLELHCNEVRQLHWSPNSIGSPILLSVNCDELAWWNVALLPNQQKETRRSRMGMSRSTSSLGFSPRSSVRLTVSPSLDSGMSSRVSNELQDLVVRPSNGDSNGDDGDSEAPPTDLIAEAFWKKKTAKHDNRLALLSVVPLPPGCNSKICVSRDFRKFLSVDIHGTVSNFELYNYK